LEDTADKWVVIVDDQQSDRHLLARCLARLGIINPILQLSDGHEAIRYLNGSPPFQDRQQFPLPAAMFLDLKLPVINGWEVLDWIHGLSLKRNFLLFVYSEIRNVAEVRKVYAMGADSFLAKPINEIDLANLVHQFPVPWQFKEGQNLLP
jgi:CheY-like chemotaxis protein